jgi:hypothetical protein
LDSRADPIVPQSLAVAVKLMGDIGDAAVPDPFPTRRFPRDHRPLRSLIVAGYTRLQTVEPYKPVRDIVRKLNHRAAEGDATAPAAGPPLFQGVDLLPEVERAGREDIYAPWLDAFKRHDIRQKAFSLRLPFADLDVTPVSGEGSP